MYLVELQVRITEIWQTIKALVRFLQFPFSWKHSLNDSPQNDRRISYSGISCIYIFCFETWYGTKTEPCYAESQKLLQIIMKNKYAGTSRIDRNSHKILASVRSAPDLLRWNYFAASGVGSGKPRRVHHKWILFVSSLSTQRNKNFLLLCLSSVLNLHFQIMHDWLVRPVFSSWKPLVDILPERNHSWFFSG